MNFSFLLHLKICLKGQCNASYAFAAAGVLEGVKALSSDKTVVLSEQNIIDCSGSQS